MAANGDPVKEPSTCDAIYRIARLTPYDGPQLQSFRKQVIASLENPDFLHEEVDEAGFVTRLLGRAALTLAIFENAQICACTSVILPDTMDDLASFGLDKRASVQGPPSKMAYVAGTMVGKMVRGMGFQNTLTRLRSDVLNELGRRQHFATAALGNHFSWRNALSNGFHVADLLEIDDPIHGRLIRLLLRRQDIALRVRNSVIWADTTQIEQHQRLLSSGLVGMRYRFEGGAPEIGYQSIIDR